MLFKSAECGYVNKMAPIDKLSAILTLLAFIFLHEQITMLKAIGIVLICSGAYWRIERNSMDGKSTGKVKLADMGVLYAV